MITLFDDTKLIIYLKYKNLDKDEKYLGLEVFHHNETKGYFDLILPDIYHTSTENSYLVLTYGGDLGDLTSLKFYLSLDETEIFFDTGFSILRVYRTTNKLKSVSS